MLETGTGTGVQQASPETSRALAMATKSSRPGYGLAVFDKKGELSRADGATVFPGGIVDLQGLGPHLQHGDVDFQVPVGLPLARCASLFIGLTRKLGLVLDQKKSYWGSGIGLIWSKLDTCMMW